MRINKYNPYQNFKSMPSETYICYNCCDECIEYLCLWFQSVCETSVLLFHYHHGLGFSSSPALGSELHVYEDYVYEYLIRQYGSLQVEVMLETWDATVSNFSRDIEQLVGVTSSESCYYCLAASLSILCCSNTATIIYDQFMLFNVLKTLSDCLTYVYFEDSWLVVYWYISRTRRPCSLLGTPPFFPFL